MTTPPVVSVTDELIAELEQECQSGVDIYIGRRAMRALLSERAELKLDAERYRWLREQEAEEGIAVLNVSGWERPATCWALTYPGAESLDAAIDAAMQS